MIPSLNIDYDVPALRLADSIQLGLDLMDEYKIFHLPVVDGNKYLGYVSEEILLGASVQTINELVIAGEQQYTTDSESLYASLKMFSVLNLSSLAVLNGEKEFLGVITIHSVFRAFAEISSIRSSGGVFSLIIKQNDYSLAELSRIIESNGYKILSTELLTVADDPMKVEVVFKLNSNDLSSVYASLERYGYQVNMKFGKDVQDVNNKGRIDQLINFLNL